MNLENINSGDDYANLLIANMEELRYHQDESDFHPAIFELWCDNVRLLCRKRYRDYIKEIADTFLLSDEDMRKALQEATTAYIEQGIEELLDREVIEMSIDDKGEVLYSLTGKGKGLFEEFNDWDDNKTK